jgi:dCMP deaminase
MNQRPNWDNYFLAIVKVVSLRQTCDRGQTGCLIVKNNHILATGYAGSPPGLPHCDDVGHSMERSIPFINYNHSQLPVGAYPKEIFGDHHDHCIRTIHAEMNAINQAAKYGIAIEGATLYCSITPCYRCCMSIISVGIKRVVCQKKYHQGEISEKMFKDVGIDIIFKEDEIVKYNNQ